MLRFSGFIPHLCHLIVKKSLLKIRHSKFFFYKTEAIIPTSQVSAKVLDNKIASNYNSSLKPLKIFDIAHIFYFNYSRKCEVVSYCDFNSHSPFPEFIGHLSIFL